MSRIKRGTTSLKRRRNVLKKAKGYRFARSKKEAAARETLLHAGVHAYRDRRDKKGTFRRLWQIKINAAVRPHNLSYSRFIDSLKKNKIEIDRKILATLAEKEPAIFEALINQLKVKTAA